MITVISGNDIGNGYTKFKGGKFASKVKNGTLTKGLVGGLKNKSDVHQVVYKGKEYVVGEGSSFTGETRYTTQQYTIALLTSIALSTQGKDSNITAKIVVGVPINHQKSKSDIVERHLKSLGVQEITVDGIDYIIDMAEVTVFVEGAYPILEGIDDLVITIDIGAGTVNIIEWEGQSIVDRHTLDQSFNKLCLDIVSFLNENHSLGLIPADGEKYIGAKTIMVNGKEVEVPELDEILDSFIAETVKTVDSLHTKTCKNIFVFGGGAKATITNWKKYYPHAKLVTEAQFVNQKVYQAVAETIYQDEK